MNEYTYILASHTVNNYAVLLQAISDFPNLVENKQIGKAYERHSDDIVSDGQLLMNASQQQHIYVKAKTSELDPAILLQIEDAQVYTRDTQPFSDYWLNV